MYKEEQGQLLVDSTNWGSPPGVATVAVLWKNHNFGLAEEKP